MIQDFRNYQRNAVKTAAKQEDLSIRLAVLGLGLAGEAGEVVEHIKKAIGHGHILPIEAIGKEIGDVLWYLANLAEELDLDLGVLADANIAKLKARYPDGFSTHASINRTLEAQA